MQVRKLRNIAGYRLDTCIHELSHIDRSRTDGHTDGFVKIHVKKGTTRLTPLVRRLLGTWFRWRQ